MYLHEKICGCLADKHLHVLEITMLLWHVCMQARISQYGLSSEDNV